MIGLCGGFFLLWVYRSSDDPKPNLPDTRTKLDVRAKNAPVSQSASALSSSLTVAQRNAVRSAKSYLQVSGFSRQGLIDQLSSQYGGQYAVGDATAAVDSLNINWNTQAVKSAEEYLQVSGFSCQGLIDQLSSQYGGQYTVGQATYGATQAGICSR